MDLHDKNRIALTPPSAIDLEVAVLGACIINSRACDEMFSILKNENIFYKEHHQFIYKAIKNLFENSLPIDMLTVSNSLSKLGLLEQAGGDYYLISLTQSVASSAHLGYHCRILLQKFLSREIIKFTTGVATLAYDDTNDIFDIIDNLQKQFDNISAHIVGGSNVIPFSQRINELKLKIEKLTKRDPFDFEGCSSGFKKTNQLGYHYCDSDLIVIAARPSMGKTSLAMQICIDNLKINKTVAFISLEMSAIQLTARFFACFSNFHLKQLVRTGFDKSEYFQTYDAYANKINDFNFFIEDNFGTEITDIVLKAKYLKRKYDIKILVIDYIGLVTNRDYNQREQEVASISRRLKALAKELNIPIVALSQLSRKVEERSNKRPLMSDLRDSGAIEQDADVIQFIYRPSYYGVDVQSNREFDDMVNENCNTELIWAKNRNGGLGTINVYFDENKTKFSDYYESEEVCQENLNDVKPGSIENAF